MWTFYVTSKLLFSSQLLSCEDAISPYVLKLLQAMKTHSICEWAIILKGLRRTLGLWQVLWVLD
jgi:hypothetical protein